MEALTGIQTAVRDPYVGSEHVRRQLPKTEQREHPGQVRQGPFSTFLHRYEHRWE
jgi:hypothetical protein